MGSDCPFFSKIRQRPKTFSDHIYMPYNPELASPVWLGTSVARGGGRWQRVVVGRRIIRIGQRPGERRADGCHASLELLVPAFGSPDTFHLLRIGAGIDAPVAHHLEIDGTGAAM